MSFACVVLTQALLTVPLDGRPARFGVPLPAGAVARGLRAGGGAVLQWRRLPIGSATADPVWVELALVGRGRVRIEAGGAGPCEHGRGPAFVREQSSTNGPFGVETRTVWRWCSGEVDERVRTEFTAGADVDGETFAAGEALTRWNGEPAARAAALCRLARSALAGFGVPVAAGGAAADLRAELAAAVPALRELPGRRGAGDYGRSGGVVTNLEYDTTLALLRCALATGDEALLARAARSAQHTVDRDLDRRSGLPFPHGRDHRTGAPEPGHAWLQGLLAAGCWFADDAWLAAASGLGRALATAPSLGEGRAERARDFAWPLGELEALLAVAPDPAIAAAADRLACAIASRYDAAAATFRFGEGELGAGLYLERAWITGGIVLPALEAHLQRRPDATLAERVRAVQAALLRRIAAARGGIPTHWRCARGEAFGLHLARGDPKALLMLEGLPRADLARLLRRRSVRPHLLGAVRDDDPDLATAWTMVARCAWVWR